MREDDSVRVNTGYPSRSVGFAVEFYNKGVHVGQQVFLGSAPGTWEKSLDDCLKEALYWLWRILRSGLCRIIEFDPDCPGRLRERLEVFDDWRFSFILDEERRANNGTRSDSEV